MTEAALFTMEFVAILSVVLLTTVCKSLLKHKRSFVFPFAETHRTVLSLISCFAGGVFLAACLLDIIPDYLSDINAELEAQKVEVRPKYGLIWANSGLNKSPHISYTHLGCN